MGGESGDDDRDRGDVRSDVLEHDVAMALEQLDDPLQDALPRLAARERLDVRADASVGRARLVEPEARLKLAAAPEQHFVALRVGRFPHLQRLVGDEFAAVGATGVEDGRQDIEVERALVV